jgi:hypothetical protein
VKQGKEIGFTPNGSGSAAFSYSISGKVITITGLTLAQISSIKEIKKVLRQVSRYHQGSIASYRILYATIDGLGGKIRWDGSTWKKRDDSGLRFHLVGG